MNERSTADLRVAFLRDGAQPAERTARQLAAFLDAAERTLDIAIYDFVLGPLTAGIVGDALHAAQSRGVRIRLVYEGDHQDPGAGPPPPVGTAGFVLGLGLAARPVASFRALMHQKYVVRDADTVWTGSTNWTDDAWSREENAILEIPSPVLAAHYGSDFEALWQRGHVVRTVPQDGGRADLRYAGRVVPATVLFAPGEGRALAHTASTLIATATRRLRIASPVLTNGGILGALADAVTHNNLEIIGAYDRTQMAAVVRQWEDDPRTAWKAATWRAIAAHGDLAGKRSIPYSPTSTHDFMHAKILVADDTVLTGSYNLSNNGRDNAENALLLPDAGLADVFSAYVEAVAAQYRASTRT